jgi:hypothetical protein
MDDVIVFNKDYDSHLKHFKEVFEVFRKHKLSISPNKAKLAQLETHFCGFRVSEQSVGTVSDTLKVVAINKFSKPK